MSNYNHQEIPVAYPPPPTSSYPSYSGAGGPYVMAPPPMGYPNKDGYGEEHNQHSSGKTESRGDGFLKGCFAALCCCCVLDACF